MPLPRHVPPMPVVLCAFLVFPVCARAQEAPPSALPVILDTIPTAPSWTSLAVSGGLVVSVATLDGPLRRQVFGDGIGPLSWARVLETMGEVESVAPALALLWAGAETAGRPRLAEGASHAALALAATGGATWALKSAVGRGRPDRTERVGDFRPFTLDGDRHAFPSGHTSTAFALATALDAETDSPWLAGAAYVGAATVGWSRMGQARHWLSDVVGGAAVGHLVSRWVLARLHAPPPAPAPLAPPSPPPLPLSPRTPDRQPGSDPAPGG